MLLRPLLLKLRLQLQATRVSEQIPPSEYVTVNDLSVYFFIRDLCPRGIHNHKLPQDFMSWLYLNAMKKIYDDLFTI